MYSCQIFNILKKIQSSWYLLLFFKVFKFFFTKTVGVYYYRTSGGRWGCWVFPILITKETAGTENRMWCSLDSKCAFQSHRLLGAWLKLNVAITEQWQPNKISKSLLIPLVRHLLPILICCPPLTNAWRKSVIWSHLVHAVTRYHTRRIRSHEVNSPSHKAGLGIF